MADAIQKTKVTHEVVLTLSSEEAEALMAVFYRVGGNPRGQRGHIDHTIKALKGVGYNFPDEANDPCGGSTSFKE